LRFKLEKNDNVVVYKTCTEYNTLHRQLQTQALPMH